jgi:hypothetical protein
MYMNEKSAKEKDKTAMEQIIDEMDVINKQYSELVYRLEKVCDKMEDSSSSMMAKECVSGDQSKPIPGHVSAITSSLHHSRNLNGRLMGAVERLEKYI